MKPLREMTNSDKVDAFREQWRWMAESAADEDVLIDAKRAFFRFLGIAVPLGLHGCRRKGNHPDSSCYLCEADGCCGGCQILWRSVRCDSYGSEYWGLLGLWPTITPDGRRDRMLEIANLPLNPNRARSK